MGSVTNIANSSLGTKYGFTVQPENPNGPVTKTTSMVPEKETAEIKLPKFLQKIFKKETLSFSAPSQTKQSGKIELGEDRGTVTCRESNNSTQTNKDIYCEWNGKTATAQGLAQLKVPTTLTRGVVTSGFRVDQTSPDETPRVAVTLLPKFSTNTTSKTLASNTPAKIISVPLTRIETEQVESTLDPISRSDLE